MLSVIFKARKFVKGFLRGFCWKFQGFLPPFDHPRHLKIGSNPPGCLGCSKNRPSAPPCRKQGLIPRRTIS